MSGPLQLYLVPGFFGFVNFGTLVYFSHVREFLEEEFSARGRRVVIHRATVPPTASIATRATVLARYIAETAPEDGGPIHIIGHSTGGLDARLLCSPGVTLGDLDVEAIASRIRSVTTIATPHHGTPLASFFTGLLGQRLLRLLSLVTVEILRQGAIPVALLAKIGATLARLRLPGSKSAQLLDHLYQELLGELPPDQRDQVSAFFEDVTEDQALLPQLTPAALHLFNASAADRDSVRYGCVIAMAPPPSMRSRLQLGRQIMAQAGYTLYHWLHRQSGFPGTTELGPLNPEAADMVLRAYGRGIRPSDNDGIVPTHSQIHGDLLFAAQADHLDLIGHFDDEAHHPPHHDWLTTQAGFNRGRFESLWTTVTDYIAPASETGVR